MTRVNPKGPVDWRKTVSSSLRLKDTSGKEVPHVVSFFPDGTVKLSVDKAEPLDVTEEVLKLGAATSLGFSPSQPSAISFAALILVGLRSVVGNGQDDIGQLGGWYDTYVRFETNRLVKSRIGYEERLARRARKRAA